MLVLSELLTARSDSFGVQAGAEQAALCVFGGGVLDFGVKLVFLNVCSVSLPLPGHSASPSGRLSNTLHTHLKPQNEQIQTADRQRGNCVGLI